MPALTLLLTLACAEPLAPCAPGPDRTSLLVAPEVTPELSLDGLEDAVTDTLQASAVWPVDFLDTWRDIALDIGELGPGDETESGCEAGLVESTDTPGHQTALCFTDEVLSGRTYAVQGTWMADVALDGSQKFANLLYSFHATRLATGDAVVGGGHFFGIWTPMAADRALSFTFQDRGTYLDSGADDALAHGVGAGTEWTGFWAEGIGFDAAFDGPMGTGSAGLDLHDVRIEQRAGPGAVGRVLLRDPGGGWWEIVLDEDHSGCGTATFDGADMGRTCAGLALAEGLDALFERGMEDRW